MAWKNLFDEHLMKIRYWYRSIKRVYLKSKNLKLIKNEKVDF